MMLKVTEYPTFKETVISKKLASGLNVVILPKSGFVRKSATLVVPFGSLSHKVKLSETEVATFPPGTAHFLEHMLFETTHENNSRKFALLGASVNAYTTYNRTAVYFSTTNGFVETLTVMFDMIMSASFTEEGIAKERAIIEKEILLYRDEPEQQLYYDLIKLMYPNHPIHYDIAGSEETIKEIDKELLKKAYAAFYHPQAMLLVLSGDFAIEETLFAIENHPLNQKERVFANPQSLFEIDEEMENREISRYYDSLTDLVLVGVKLKPLISAQEEDIALQELKLSLLIDNLFGKSTPIFKKLQASRIVNNAYDINVACDKEFAYLTFFTETKKCEKTIVAFKSMIEAIRNTAIDGEEFAIQKKKLLGGFVQVFDSVSRANAMLSEYYLRNIDVFRLIEAIDKLDKQDLESLKDEIAFGAVACVCYKRKQKRKVKRLEEKR